MFFVNKLDKVGGDFFRCVKSIEKELGVSGIPIQIPLFRNNKLFGLADLIEQKGFEFDFAVKEEYQRIELTDKEKEQVRRYRRKLLINLSHFDDHLLLKIGDKEVEISEKEIIKVLRKTVVAGKLFPILCGSSFRNVGVKFLLDMITNCFASPFETKYFLEKIFPEKRSLSVPKLIEESIAHPLVALSFKLAYDVQGGGKVALFFVRIYLGSIKKGSYVYNVSRNCRERISRILLIHANKKEEINEAFAGDVVGLIGLKNTFTGDTLTHSPDQCAPLEKMKFTNPVISFAIEPISAIDNEKLPRALEKIAFEDPTFTTEIKEEINQIIISGMGELHLMVITERLARDFNVKVNIVNQRVAYKETITKIIHLEERYKRQTGGHGQFAHIFLKLEP